MSLFKLPCMTNYLYANSEINLINWWQNRKSRLKKLDLVANVLKKNKYTHI